MTEQTPPTAVEAALAARLMRTQTRETWLIVRKTTALSAADSLRALGPSEARTFFVRKGGDGPESFPANAVVIMDIRFVARH
jgi:hypothetical protein